MHNVTTTQSHSSLGFETTLLHNDAMQTDKITILVGDPDGCNRPVITVYDAKNAMPKWDRQRHFSAPLIRARNREILEIQFTNILRDQSTSIHFHGLHMLNNPCIDGVKMITQCPIHIGIIHILINIVALPTPTIGHLGNSYETYIEYLEYGNVYEVLLVNTDTHPHPFHLHGCFVNFTTFDTLVTQISDHYDECNEYRFDMTTVKYDRMLPPYDQVGSILSVGDSFTVPSKGYVVFRFKTNNPSPWLSHCYMEWHIFPVWHWFSQLVTKMGNHITN
ncbi:unnamed protein product [Rotaria socialis]|uniref:Plastocyanin-like domain-containing protein n=1 Tax=Rotaria socialis TaxID=392032 RepID=A0A820P572_9BILA|nr:unnamed protein product [Rotaria socialis]